MKKLIIMALAVLLCLPALTASALDMDLSTATLEELLQLQQDVANRISELRAAETSTAERVELSGSGTAILSDVAIPFSPSRIILEAEGDISVKLTGGSSDYSYSATDYNAVFFDQEGTYTVLVEATGAWSFTVEPILSGGTLPMSGSGPYVSDFFELPAPMIVTIKGSKGTMTSLLSNFIVKLRCQYKNMNLWQADSLTNQLFSSSSEPFSADVILNPVTGRTQYCLSITCDPGVEWSITAK